MLVKLPTGKELTAFVPGEGHNLQVSYHGLIASMDFWPLIGKNITLALAPYPLSKVSYSGVITLPPLEILGGYPFVYTPVLFIVNCHMFLLTYISQCLPLLFNYVSKALTPTIYLSCLSLRRIGTILINWI